MEHNNFIQLQDS